MDVRTFIDQYTLPLPFFILDRPNLPTIDRVNEFSQAWLTQQMLNADKQQVLEKEFFEKFSKMPDQAGIPGWSLCAEGWRNYKKNRHGYFPYDDNIYAPRLSPDMAPYYHNASKISLRDYQWVAAQAPMANTIDDFWHAVIAGGSNKIVTLAMPMENQQDKCFNYWQPGSRTIWHNGERLGEIHLLSEERLDKVDHDNEYTMRMIGDDQDIFRRQFKWVPVKGGGEFKDIEQFHFRNWVDMKVPRSELINKFLDRIDAAPTTGPKMVHCSAGAGRTGAFIALDFYKQLIDGELKKLESGQNIRNIRMNVSVVETVLTMRKQRQAMVKTDNQLHIIQNALIARYHPLYEKADDDE